VPPRGGEGKATIADSQPTMSEPAFSNDHDEPTTTEISNRTVTFYDAVVNSCHRLKYPPPPLSPPHPRLGCFLLSRAEY
jgi:hypothetical protein